MNIRLIVVFTFLFALVGSAQTDTTNISKEIDDAKKNARFYRYSRYIPFDILDCIRVVSATADKDQIEEFKKRSREKVLQIGFDSTETGLRYNWELEGQNHLTHYFNNLGLYYHKTMKMVVSLCYHQHLNQQAVNLKQNITQARKVFRKEERFAKKRTKTVRKAYCKSNKKTIKKENFERKNAYKSRDKFYRGK